MSLESGVAAIIASCMSPFHEDYFHTEPKAGYQVRARYGVNKLYWKTWEDLTLEWYCPGYPTTLGLRFYEHQDNPSLTDPILNVNGYVALCAQPPPALGATQWLWMATLNWMNCNSFSIPVTQVHVMYQGTAAGSIGMIRYPLIPPI